VSNRAGHAQTRINSLWRHCAHPSRLRRLRVLDDADTRPQRFVYAEPDDQNGKRLRDACRLAAVPRSGLDLDAEIVGEPAAGNAVCIANDRAGAEKIARNRNVQETQTRHDVLLGRHDRVSFADAGSVDVAKYESKPDVRRSLAVSDAVARHCEQLREQLAVRRRSAWELTSASKKGLLLFVFLKVEMAAVFRVRKNVARFAQHGLR
jgi:hypothetical protein